MRKNHIRRSKDRVEDFDRVYMDWPEMPHIATVTAMPLKTKFINIACSPWANIDKVIFDVEELQAYLPNWFIW